MLVVSHNVNVSLGDTDGAPDARTVAECARAVIMRPAVSFHESIHELETFPVLLDRVLGSHCTELGIVRVTKYGIRIGFHNLRGDGLACVITLLEHFPVQSRQLNCLFPGRGLIATLSEQVPCILACSHYKHAILRAVVVDVVCHIVVSFRAFRSVTQWAMLSEEIEWHGAEGVSREFVR